MSFESRPPSTMRTSAAHGWANAGGRMDAQEPADSHTVAFPPPFLLYGKTPAVAPDNKEPVWVSRVPDTSLHTCHALSPRQVSEVSPMRPPMQDCCTCVDLIRSAHPCGAPAASSPLRFGSMPLNMSSPAPKLPVIGADPRSGRAVARTARMVLCLRLVHSVRRLHLYTGHASVAPVVLPFSCAFTPAGCTVRLSSMYPAESSRPALRW